MSGNRVDVRIVLGESTSAGVEHGAILADFAEAVALRDEDQLSRTRAAVLGALGPEGLVDAAGVASNFERMVRIADGTGIPLDDRLAAMSAAVREELNLDRFRARG